MLSKNLYLKIALGVVIGFVVLQPNLSSSASQSQLTAAVDSEPFVGGEFQVTGHTGQTSIGGENPAAAYNFHTHRFLAVWENLGGSYREIYAQLISPGGQLLGDPIAISTGSNDRIRPCVAYNGIENEFMVLWMYDASGNGSRYQIQGQRISGDGQLIGEAFTVKADGGLSFWSPRLAWSGISNLYMLAWSAQDGSSTPVEIGMKALFADGSTRTEDTYRVTDVRPTQPDVAYNPVDGEFLVVWGQQNSDGSYSLIGDLRDFDGNRVAYKSDVFTIYTPQSHPVENPRAAFGSGLRYVVVFEREFTSDDHDIHLSFIDRYAYYSPYSIAIADSYIEEVSPQIVADMQRLDLMIVYQKGSSGSQQLWLRLYGGSLSGIYLVCSQDNWDCALPVLTYGASNNLVTYIGGEPGFVAHMYGKMLAFQAVFLPVVRKR